MTILGCLIGCVPDYWSARSAVSKIHRGGQRPETAWDPSLPGHAQDSASTADHLFAEPLESDDEHEVIWRVDQECDESLVVSAEMQRS